MNIITLPKKHIKVSENKLVIGWYEWTTLPNLKIPAIKAKIDTGAQTSALHAENIKVFTKNGNDWARFTVFPLQGKRNIKIRCSAQIIDERTIMSSNGHKEHRFVIKTILALSNQSWEIELTLSNRDPLKFRMLLGRQALKHHTLISPGSTCLQGKFKRSIIKKLYTFQ